MGAVGGHGSEKKREVRKLVLVVQYFGSDRNALVSGKRSTMVQKEQRL